jgi:hypothetical protein
MDKLKSSPANITILAAGAVMLIAAFLPFYSFLGHTVSAFDKGVRFIALVPVLFGVVMAVQVALVAFAPNVKLPERIAGFTWDQIHLVLGFQAAIMMLAFLIRDTLFLDKDTGFYLMLLAAIALLVGAILRTRESQSTTA